MLHFFFKDLAFNLIRNTVPCLPAIDIIEVVTPCVYLSTTKHLSTQNTGDLVQEQTVWKHCIDACSTTGHAVIHSTMSLTKADSVQLIDASFRTKHGDDFEKALKGVVTTCQEYYRLFNSTALIIIEVDELIGATVSSKVVTMGASLTDTKGTSEARSNTRTNTTGNNWSDGTTRSTSEGETLTNSKSWSESRGTSTTLSASTTVGVTATVTASIFPSASVSTSVSSTVGVAHTTSSTSTVGGSSSRSTCVTNSYGTNSSIGGSNSVQPVRATLLNNQVISIVMSTMQSSLYMCCNLGNVIVFFSRA